ncbi:MAG TPA: anti-sigma factor [Candidatus Binataceae bacterium]|nr:anti-sigma factor [Candidatus Binataceae bacterium]
MEHEEIKNLLPLAALDRLDADEQRLLDEHLGECAECSAELREFRETAAALATALEAPAVEDRIWNRLEARLNPVRSASPISNRQAAVRRATLWRPAALVMTGVAAAASIYAFVTSARLGSIAQQRSQELASLNQEITNLHSDLSMTHGEVAIFRRVLDERQRLQKVLTQPDLQLTRLAPLKAAPHDARAIVAVSAANHAAMIQVSGLPSPPSGKTYELWWITKESGPIAAGLFGTAADGGVVAKAELPPPGEHVIATAVTLEPADGVSKPTGEMYLKGS